RGCYARGKPRRSPQSAFVSWFSAHARKGRAQFRRGPRSCSVSTSNVLRLEKSESAWNSLDHSLSFGRCATVTEIRTRKDGALGTGLHARGRPHHRDFQATR